MAAEKVVLDFTATGATLPPMSTAPRSWSDIEPLECRIAPAIVSALNLSSLDGTNGFKIQGEAASDSAGRAVAGAGDVNGDGIADLLIGAGGVDANDTNSGAAYVVFGKPGGFTTPLNLSALDGTNGFKMQGEVRFDFAGTSVSGAGDVNGDGFDDVIVGANAAGPGLYAGSSYVVFGKASGFTTPLNLSSLDGSNGFKILGEAASDFAGSNVSNAGDVNGDGFADLILGARGADANGPDSGASYVVFGKAGGFTATLSLSSLNGTNGFKIVGEAPSDNFGRVRAAGDVNGDGFADVIIGAEGADLNGNRSGASYVVFGKANGFAASLSASSLNGTNGFKILGEVAEDFSGYSVSGAGDVNGDGFADVIVAAASASPNGSQSGAAYVVFGHGGGGFPASLNLSSLNGSNGFKLQGEALGDFAGRAVSGLGDVNGDGFADVFVGAPKADPNGVDSGASYVVFGKAGGFTTPLNLSSLNGTNGFKLLGQAASESSGEAGRGVGDVNGDGVDDFILGASGASPNGTGSGVAYVIYGQPAVKVGFSKDGRTGIFQDADGDLVTVKISKGELTQRDFTFSGGVWQRLDLASGGKLLFGGAKLSIAVKKSFAGNGTVNLGFLDARGLDLGTVAIAGDLGQIDAGDGNPRTAAVAALTLGSLGAVGGTQPAATVNPLVSDLTGGLGKLTVKGAVKGAIAVTGGLGANIGPVSIGGDLDGSAGGVFAGLLRAGGNIGPVSVKGSIIGGADFSGIVAGGKLGAVSVGGDLRSANAAKPVSLSALGKLGAKTAADAVAIAGVTVLGDVLNARILAGFTASLGAANADAGIGAIAVGKTWTASSVAAGVADSTGNGFGRNDTRIAGDTTPAIVATIASITIKGTAIGSTAGNDFFGITAQRIVKATIGGTKVTLTSGIDDELLDPTNNDFRLVDFA